MYKYIFCCIITIILVGLLIFAFNQYNNNKQPKTEIVKQEIVKPVEIRVVEKYIKGDIDTVYIDKKPQQVASYETKIDTLDTIVDVKIRYFIDQNKFDSDIKVNTLERQTIIEQKTYVTPKPKLIRIISGLSIGFKNSTENNLDLSNVGIDAGIKIKDKYSVSLFGNTDNVFGVRLGIDF